MKKVVDVFVVVCLIFLVGYATDTQKTSEQTEAGQNLTGFRGIEWGSTHEQVKKYEQEEFLGDSEGKDGIDSTIFSAKITGKDCVILYQFIDDVFVQGGYIFNEKYMNSNNYIHDYRNVQFDLADKYGIPDIDNTNWLNDLYKDDPENYGTAVSIGHLNYHSEWNLDKTKIIHDLRGEGFDISHAVLYVSKAHEKLIAETKENAKKEIW